VVTKDNPNLVTLTADISGRVYGGEIPHSQKVVYGYFTCIPIRRKAIWSLLKAE